MLDFIKAKLYTDLIYIAVFSMPGLPNLLHAQVKNDPELYLLTGNANKANRDAIQTWEGVVEFNTSHAGLTDYAPFFYTAKSEIRFYYDRKQDKFLFKKKPPIIPTEYLTIKTRIWKYLRSQTE